MNVPFDEILDVQKIRGEPHQVIVVSKNKDYPDDDSMDHTNFVNVSTFCIMLWRELKQAKQEIKDLEKSQENFENETRGYDP